MGSITDICLHSNLVDDGAEEEENVDDINFDSSM